MSSFHLLSMKTLAAAGAVAATLGLGVVVAQAATTEDDFGQQVKAQVQACQASRAATSERGIGHCVSTWVLAHNPGHASRTREATPEPSESPEAKDGGDGGRPASHPTPHSTQGQAHGHSGH